MLERRFWSNCALILLLLTSISIWHIYTSHSITIRSAYDYNTSTRYSPLSFTLHTANSSYKHPMYQLPQLDYNTLMNLTTFDFAILNKCKTWPLLLILVHSAPNNYHRRKSIRETWGSKLQNASIFFMLGLARESRLQKKIAEENRNHRDIVQGTFLDVYRNVTYKHVMSLKFAIYHCPNAKYILKTDDDVFVNMPRIVNFLTVDLSPYGAERLLSCSKRAHSPVKRSFRSKWRVSFNEYQNEYYPAYCPGWVIMYSPDVIFVLYREVQKFDYFWIDDVLITGILRERENIEIHDATSMILPCDNLKKILQHEIIDQGADFLYGPADLSIREMYALFHLVKNVSSLKSRPSARRFLKLSSPK
ncbi:hypothetical protein PPYR_13369 [Photinus pyralis]|uniref:Hexosyltransferase n=3 Tax=Photinus pyralis TaxID=7054 RepID=A0A5N4A8Y3_PHOPY|nr:beta-1,3-galactosyltransferase 5-like [Photinus pyralis]XP_031349116.1 beta-1,3-galactosyltransferase 5-like [Photinus pyralis]XP_031349117.1 beta-1,3-galactosyltransferase 5-like [Photinus pyralis]XP_031353876.1 beta-1,3-galactosyltransferase 5-like [Photinus pyralis]XP_031353877.1 beta-1,3-galactosyltransferase 5-like [Photinus pyralis]XP_031353878.1 beta-1,3-galactosyltransferase 5-like [Photinus pyralis]KAB0793749.1 hypothetical protein PPYR_13369 [Photinus pyralis]